MTPSLLLAYTGTEGRPPFHHLVKVASSNSFSYAIERGPWFPTCVTGPQVVSLSALGPGPSDRVVGEVTALLDELVSGGAALGWVNPPPREEVAQLLADICRATAQQNADIIEARVDDSLVGFGYWRRYARATHWPHADLERVAVASGMQRRGIGRTITSSLLDSALAAGIEQMTLDLRGDNLAAAAMYGSLGFREYGRLTDFVAVGERRYDKVLMVKRLR